MSDHEELRRLLAEATQGPWVQHRDYVTAPEADEQGWHVAHCPFEREDADLIVAMRNALPGLLDRIDALRDTTERLGAERDGARAEVSELAAAWPKDEHGVTIDAAVTQDTFDDLRRRLSDALDEIETLKASSFDDIALMWEQRNAALAEVDRLTKQAKCKRCVLMRCPDCIGGAL